MSMYPTDRRCPRCQYPVPPGAQTCGNCGLVLSGPPQMPYSTEPAPPTYSAPSTPGSPFGPPPSTGPYGTGGYNGPAGYDFTPQPPPPPPGASSYYTGSQPQPGLPGTAPAYLGSQPQPGFPTPGMPQPPTQQRSGGGLRIAIIVLVVLVVLGGGGGALAYFLTRPKPTIDVTSMYKVGSTPAGSTSTTLQVTGEKFSSNSTITFLLDGQPAPGNQTALSDSNGDVKATLTITADWGVGQHIITARDANNYVTQQGFTVSIVAQGEANTPGPNGAPADDTPSFNLNVTINSQDAVTGQTYDPFNDHLTVTGQPDPAGGKVCNPQYDDNGPHTNTGTTNGVSYVETQVFSCSGTYKGGKLSYTEHATEDQIVFGNGVTCTAQVPYVFEQLDGTFTDGQNISGTYSEDAITFTCTNGQSIQLDPSKGTWTGTI
jgi:hypothetical protein